jgi:predicted nuclease of restriction endonuclease-like (RecB) superfamily
MVMDFGFLVERIEKTHLLLKQAVVKAINIHLTLRNWLIGCYIVEFEQNGEDKAKYGAKLLPNLSAKLRINGLSNINERELRRYKLFYQTYPQLFAVFIETKIWTMLSLESSGLSIRGTPFPELINETDFISAKKIINNLSFSHLAELIEISEPVKRTFYEIESIKGLWSVKELRRQINTLYFERMGLSSDPEQMSMIIQSNAERQNAADIIKSHFAFEFLDIRDRSLIEESNLEQSLLDHFQDFLFEMGRGFCLEARQKRILIGGEYFFIDMVLYHRILKCHVLIELKSDKFNHSHISQLNTYLNYYKKEMMESSDNPPVGILMVADKNNPLVEYALAGLDNQLFVSRYLIQLPDKSILHDFIASEIRKDGEKI